MSTTNTRTTKHSTVNEIEPETTIDIHGAVLKAGGIRSTSREVDLQQGEIELADQTVDAIKWVNGRDNLERMPSGPFHIYGAVYDTYNGSDQIKIRSDTKLEPADENELTGKLSQALSAGRHARSHTDKNVRRDQQTSNTPETPEEAYDRFLKVRDVIESNPADLSTRTVRLQCPFVDALCKHEVHHAHLLRWAGSISPCNYRPQLIDERKVKVTNRHDQVFVRSPRGDADPDRFILEVPDEGMSIVESELEYGDCHPMDARVSSTHQGGPNTISVDRSAKSLITVIREFVAADIPVIVPCDDQHILDTLDQQKLFSARRLKEGLVTCLNVVGHEAWRSLHDLIHGPNNSANQGGKQGQSSNSGRY
ncbi:hypothetical protein [Halovenus sp. HT40]|uniref:hypothetical protein n=1 Tax=Halovenus sp. HT40 TaxID=3126691 RepID=UPI00300F7AF5